MKTMKYFNKSAVKKWQDEDEDHYPEGVVSFYAGQPYVHYDKGAMRLLLPYSVLGTMPESLVFSLSFGGFITMLPDNVFSVPVAEWWAHKVFGKPYEEGMEDGVERARAALGLLQHRLFEGATYAIKLKEDRYSSGYYGVETLFGSPFDGHIFSSQVFEDRRIIQNECTCISICTGMKRIVEPNRVSPGYDTQLQSEFFIGEEKPTYGLFVFHSKEDDEHPPVIRKMLYNYFPQGYCRLRDLGLDTLTPPKRNLYSHTNCTETQSGFFFGTKEHKTRRNKVQTECLEGVYASQLVTRADRQSTLCRTPQVHVGYEELAEKLPPRCYAPRFSSVGLDGKGELRNEEKFYDLTARAACYQTYKILETYDGTGRLTRSQILIPSDVSGNCDYGELICGVSNGRYEAIGFKDFLRDCTVLLDTAPDADELPTYDQLPDRQQRDKAARAYIRYMMKANSELPQQARYVLREVLLEDVPIMGVVREVLDSLASDPTGFELLQRRFSYGSYSESYIPRPSDGGRFEEFLRDSVVEYYGLQTNARQRSQWRSSALTIEEWQYENNCHY